MSSSSAEELVAASYLNHSLCYRSSELFSGLRMSGTFLKSGVSGATSVALSINFFKTFSSQ